MSQSRIATLLACLVVVASSPTIPATAAQTSDGRITGIVLDASGVPLPGARITIANEQTARTWQLRSGDEGRYVSAGLPPGRYTVTVEFEGLRRGVRTGLEVTSGATVTADVTLQAGLQEEITVTGTRVPGRTATDTPAPVDFIDSQAIQGSGAVETGKILQLVAPSFNFSTTYISDGTDIIRPATLRALGPDQVLVLVNGKRRHQQALLNVQQTIARGSAGYDVNAIPASAIDHIEVLRDGAAAQYGSDAIAGVINVILKEQTDTTDATFELGQTYESDGEVFLGSVNTGLSVGARGFANFALEFRDRGETNRAVADSLRVTPPAVTQRIGDPDARDVLLWVNTEVPAGTGSVYAFGGWSRRRGNSSGFFRPAGDGRTVPEIYPNGFLPTIITKPTDGSLVGGYRSVLGGGRWTYDVSANFGVNRFEFREENTVNVSYYYEPTNRNDPTGPRVRESATEADTGTLRYGQFGVNLDLAGIVDWGIGAGPLNLAAGVEWRREDYKIEAGEPVSYQYGRTDDRSIVILNQEGTIAQPGTQGFPGWSPREAVDEGRSNVGLYVDAESLLAQKVLAGAAVRFENYSDFGSTINGKLSARVNFTPRFSLRGTASTGFRAPSVQQAFYSQRSTNLNAAGVLTDTLTARQDSELTRAFGVPALDDETSRNYSIGLVAKPAENVRITVDLYRIDIHDRIVFSSNIQPEDAAACGSPFSAARCPIRAILDPLAVGQVLFFTNAIDTRTAGVDVVALYDYSLGNSSSLSFEAALHVNDTNVNARRSSSAILPPEVLFDQAQITLIEEGQPGERIVIGGTYRRGGWRTIVRANYFGEVAGEGFTPGFKQTWGGKWLTDITATVPLRTDRISLSFGALNAFDVYPDEWDPVRAFPFPQLGFRYGWETLPFGINGGYYYARVNVRLNHR